MLCLTTLSIGNNEWTLFYVLDVCSRRRVLTLKVKLLWIIFFVNLLSKYYVPIVINTIMYLICIPILFDFN